jgi:hypothetical protein
VSYQPAPGDICSVLSGSRSYAIAKVIAVEGEIVHVRTYREKFLARPAAIEASALTLGRVGDPEGFGMGHLPLSRDTFARWEPHRIKSEPVIDEELEGYRAWRSESGGIW